MCISFPILLVFNFIIAVTYHNTDIESDATWYPAGNPHIIDATFSIDAGATLTISAGCVVKFNASRYINIYGSLTAIGTVSDSIIFTLNDDQTGTWNYLYHRNNSTGTFSYCKFEQSNYTIYANSSNLISVSDCLFEDNNHGLYLTTGADLELARNLITNNDRGIYLSSCSPVLRNNVIINNLHEGIKMLNSCIPDLGSNATEGNNIYENGTYDIYNGTEDISAKYTYWGDIGFFNIPDRIYDVNDDSELGLVEYEPWGNQSHTLALSQGTSPDSVSIDHVNDEIILNWNLSPDATFYEIYTNSLPDTMLTNWQVADTEVYGTEWNKPDAELLEKEFFFILGIIGE